MTTEPPWKALRRLLSPAEDGLQAYAVLDGASVPGLLPRLAQDRPEHVCLYRGELAPDLAACAPYLVRLLPGQPIAEWVLHDGWGRHWGIFALAAASLEVMRRHLRRFLIVRAPDGKRLYFRYYDPRVLSVYLPTCNAAELQYIFGPVRQFVCEGPDPTVLLRFDAGQVPVWREVVPVGPG